MLRDLWILIFLLLVYAKMGDRTLGSLYHSGGKSLGVCLYHRISALGGTGSLDAIFIFNRKGALGVLRMDIIHWPPPAFCMPGL